MQSLVWSLREDSQLLFSLLFSKDKVPASICMSFLNLVRRPVFSLFSSFRDSLPRLTPHRQKSLLAPIVVFEFGTDSFFVNLVGAVLLVVQL